MDVLANMLRHKFFPDLWQVRTALTNSGPMGDGGPAGDPGADLVDDGLLDDALLDDDLADADLADADADAVTGSR